MLDPKWSNWNSDLGGGRDPPARLAQRRQRLVRRRELPDSHELKDDLFDGWEQSRILQTTRGKFSK